MEGTRKAQIDRQQRLLLELTKVNGNGICADCASRNPRWASYSLGIFLCVRCAGIHRKMGTHISKVKSLTLDTWNKEQVERMREVGNVKSNAKFNPDEMKNRLPVNVDDSERDGEIERFIRNKYERLLFCSAPSKEAGPSVRGNHASSANERSYSTEITPLRETSGPVTPRGRVEEDEVYVPRHPRDPVRRAATRESTRVRSSTTSETAAPTAPPRRIAAQVASTIDDPRAGTGTVVRSTIVGRETPSGSSPGIAPPALDGARHRATTMFATGKPPGGLPAFALQSRPPQSAPTPSIWDDLAQLEHGMKDMTIPGSHAAIKSNASPYQPSPAGQNQPGPGTGPILNPFLYTPLPYSSHGTEIDTNGSYFPPSSTLANSATAGPFPQNGHYAHSLPTRSQTMPSLPAAPAFHSHANYAPSDPHALAISPGYQAAYPSLGPDAFAAPFYHYASATNPAFLTPQHAYQSQ